MELTELLTVGGASAIVLILIQVIKPAMALSEAAWSRFGALIAITLGVVVASAGNGALGFPAHPFEAGLSGFLAGASASGLYQAGSRAGTAVSAAISARLQKPPVSDYDTNQPQG